MDVEIVEAGGEAGWGFVGEGRGVGYGLVRQVCGVGFEILGGPAAMRHVAAGVVDLVLGTGKLLQLLLLFFMSAPSLCWFLPL